MYLKCMDFRMKYMDLKQKCTYLKLKFMDFNVGKTQLVSFDQSNNTGAIDM